MPRDFNLLATTYRGNERNACSELRYLLEQIGDATPRVNKTGISGLIAAKSSLNPIDAVKKLREFLHERPYEFRYMLRIIPVENVVRTDVSEIGKVAAELGSRIGERETFRVTVEKRFTTISTHAIIETVAANIKRKVNLEKPDKILLIEVVGGSTGISLTAPDDLLSVMKEKML
jgi:tRNA acetyltransferase TAN1